MLPERLVLCSAQGGRVEPLYLGPADYPWLRRLGDEIGSLAGRPEGELAERLRGAALAEAPPGKLRLAAHLVLRAGRARRLPVAPARIRAAVFAAAADGAGGGGRDQAVASAARVLGLSAELVERLLLADLRGERRVELPDPLPGPAELALRANLALAQALVARARRVRLEVEGNARALVRQARLRGLLCTFAPAPTGGQGFVIELEGPLSLFRRTRLYGRALAGLVPLLPWSRRYRLTAPCRLRGEEHLFELRSGDPIPPGPEPRAYDSRLERQFAADFAGRAPAWELVREPEPLVAPAGLVFPDFALVHRRDPTRRWLLEIAGFWTPAYVAAKLARLRAIAPARFVLCLDASLNCGPADLPASASVLRFQRRVDVAAVLAILEAAEGDAVVPRR